MRWIQIGRRAPGRNPVEILWWWNIVRGALRWYLTVCYGLRWYGHEHVPRRGPVLFVANHQSHFDPPAIGIAVGDRPFAGLARSTLFKSKAFAWMIRSIGSVPIERGGKGDMSAFRRALAELKAGRTVLIFPEGSRSPDGALHAFRPGAKLLLKRGGAPVIACAIEGAHDAWPIGTSLPRVRGRIAVMVGPPHDPEDLLREGPDAALETLRREIETMRLELRRRIRRATYGRWPAPGPGDVPYWERD